MSYSLRSGSRWLEMHPEDAAIVGKQLATTARLGVLLFGLAALIFAIRWW